MISTCSSFLYAILNDLLDRLERYLKKMGDLKCADGITDFVLNFRRLITVIQFWHISRSSYFFESLARELQVHVFFLHCSTITSNNFVKKAFNRKTRCIKDVRQSSMFAVVTQICSKYSHTFLNQHVSVILQKEPKKIGVGGRKRRRKI